MWRSMTWWSTQLYQFGIDKKWADLQAWRINPDLAGVSGIISTSTVWRRTLVCPVDEIVLSVLSPRPPLQELWGKDRLVLNQEWFGMIARCCQMPNVAKEPNRWWTAILWTRPKPQHFFLFGPGKACWTCLLPTTFPDLVIAFWVIFITELIPAFHTLHQTRKRTRVRSSRVETSSAWECADPLRVGLLLLGKNHCLCKQCILRTPRAHSSLNFTLCTFGWFYIIYTA